MKTWINDNLGWLITAIATTVVQAAVIGGAYTSLTTQTRANTDRITQLEDQRADQTAWRVSALEKRADSADNVLGKLSDKLDTMNATLQRIDQRTGGINGK